MSVLTANTYNPIFLRNDEKKKKIKCRVNIWHFAFEIAVKRWRRPKNASAAKLWLIVSKSSWDMSNEKKKKKRKGWK